MCKWFLSIVGPFFEDDDGEDDDYHARELFV